MTVIARLNINYECQHKITLTSGYMFTEFKQYSF